MIYSKSFFTTKQMLIIYPRCIYYFYAFLLKTDVFLSLVVLLWRVKFLKDNNIFRRFLYTSCSLPTINLNIVPLVSQWILLIWIGRQVFLQLYFARKEIPNITITLISKFANYKNCFNWGKGFCRWFGIDRDFDTDDILKDIVFFKGGLEGVSYKCKKGSEGFKKGCPLATGNYTLYTNAVSVDLSTRKENTERNYFLDS